MLRTDTITSDQVLRMHKECNRNVIGMYQECTRNASGKQYESNSNVLGVDIDNKVLNISKSKEELNNYIINKYSFIIFINYLPSSKIKK